ncbi:YDG domain-containing protein, partial [Agrobacterium tumefaciens]|uniref:YDG domain-containing protein n=1 Tax=Agrobacterium tumefaciens TaxID=358 RepID=UPI003BA16525
VSLHAPSSVSINGKIDGDSLDLISAAADFADKNAGNGKTVNITNIALSGADLANYTFTNNSATTTANITPKSVTLSGVTADNKVYDGNTLAQLSGGTLSGLVNGETIALSSSTGTFIDANAGHAKAVSLAGMGLANGSGLASNYTLAAPAALTADITPRALTVSGTIAADRSYDGTRNATLSGGTLNGLIGQETLGLTGQTGTFSDKNAGTAKAVAVSGSTLVDGTGLASNYTVANATGLTASITPKALTVNGMTAADKTFDGSSLATLTGGALRGLVDGETLTFAGQQGAFADANAGTAKPVAVSGLTLQDGTGLASNYSVTNPVGITATITAAVVPPTAPVTPITPVTPVNPPVAPVTPPVTPPVAPVATTTQAVADAIATAVSSAITVNTGGTVQDTTLANANELLNAETQVAVNTSPAGTPSQQNNVSNVPERLSGLNFGVQGDGLNWSQNTRVDATRGGNDPRN